MIMVREDGARRDRYAVLVAELGIKVGIGRGQVLRRAIEAGRGGYIVCELRRGRTRCPGETLLSMNT